MDNLFLVFEIFCNQSGNAEMENISLRILCLGINILGLVLIISFGAAITAFLAVQIVEIPFTNLDEFFENGKYKLSIDSPNFVSSYLKVGANIKPFACNRSLY